MKQDGRQRMLTGRWANVIIVNDVFEHIYDTASLLKNLSILAAPGCLLYYVVPNGLSTRFVISEGHKKVFGISTVDPDCWQFFISGRARIFYRRWPYFESQFSYFGFHHFRDLTKPSSKIESVVSDINDDCEAIKRLL
ncbi:MAG: hypothetical protein RI571_15990, partial [Roseovarius sp.]|nr:hypothetical protein [Roseovarius sp.]